MSESRARLAACYRLFAWLLERGGDIDGIEAAVVREPVLDADVLGRPREHIGIRATRDIRPGEVLLRVPRELTLDVHLLIKHSATHLARRPALANFFPSREGAVLLTGVLRDSDLAVQERVIEGATGMRAFDCDYGKVWETRGYGLEVGSAELAEAAREVKWHSVRHAMSPLLCWDLLLVVCDSLSVSSSPSPCDQCMNERTNE